MIQFEPLIRRAQKGEHEATMEIVRIFTPLVKKHSRVNGFYSEDCMQDIMVCVLSAIRSFPLK